MTPDCQQCRNERAAGQHPDGRWLCLGCTGVVPSAPLPERRCYSCRRPVEPTRTRCGPCRTKQDAYRQARRDELRTTGRCAWCLGIVTDARAVCRPCRAWKAEQYHAAKRSA